MASTVVVQVLARVLAACRGHHAGATNVAIHQESDLVGVRAKSLQNVVSASAHFVMVVSGDVGRKNLGLAGFVLGTPHGIHHQRDDLLGWAKHLVALRFVVLDEVTAEPELVSRLGKGFGAQTQLGFDDGAGNVATIDTRAAQNFPQIADVF